MKNYLRKYYLEWWVLGDDSKSIIARTFHSKHIDVFMKHFLDCKKYHVVHLEMIEPYRRIIYSRKLAQHAAA